MTSPATPAPAAPAWWKFGHVWLVLSGPAVVVVAALVTAWIAVRAPDPVIEENAYQRGLEINRTLDAQAAARSLAPALAARNHAATPTPDLPPPRP